MILYNDPNRYLILDGYFDIFQSSCIDGVVVVVVVCEACCPKTQNMPFLSQIYIGHTTSVDTKYALHDEFPFGAESNYCPLLFTVTRFTRIWVQVMDN
jgi:hypothetical protein